MIKTEAITVNMGPQHPSTHGVYRCILTLEGEVVTNCVNVMGYLHRGVEKQAEARTYTQFITYCDRLDYVASLLNEIPYVEAVEKLMQVQVPERAQFLRILTGELVRIASHLVFLGCYGLDMSAFTAWMYCFRERERILNIMEMLTGGRQMYHYCRIGGVKDDIPPGFAEHLENFFKVFPVGLEEIKNILLGNEIFIARSKNIGILSKEMAIDYGITGPNARASGVDWDLRRDRPYGGYERFDFEVPLGENGDCLDRVMMRFKEIEQSFRIAKQAWEGLPEGSYLAKMPKIIKPPAGEVFHLTEGAKGHLGFYIVSDGSVKPYRLHIHSPSFVNLGVFPVLCKGAYIQDTVLILASIDIVLGEVDR